ncbi:MAG: T9SS type B sorting domain-containing protein, partial [Microscillaceae bacterium]|nr:T9SS type B sorting domain-containing protein [Microscillaceae bacterium]
IRETPLPLFELKLCADLEVSLTLSDNQYQQYLINWGDGSPLQTATGNGEVLRRQYALGGTYVVSVTGNYIPGNCGATDARIVSPITGLNAPAVSQLTTEVNSLTEGRVRLTLSTDSNFQYRIFRTGNPLPLATIENTQGNTQPVLNNLNTVSGDVCFQIITADECGNELDEGVLYCQMTLGALAEDSQNRITWMPYANPPLPLNTFQQYVLYRNEQPIQLFTDLAANAYVDTEVDCNIEYCYRIEARFSSATLNFRSISNTACVTAFSSQIPGPVLHLNSTVETPRSVRLFWERPEGAPIVEYRIQRGGAEFASLGSETQALDTDLGLSQRLCYEVQYVNICGQLSALASRTCPVLLRASQPEAGQVLLTWTPYENPENLFVQYQVEKLDELGAVYANIPLPSLSTLQYTDLEAKTDRQVLRYRIRTVIDANRQIFSVSNVVEITQTFRLFFPNAFTPNQDGKNDVFAPKGLFIKNFRMSIYNRLGLVMATVQSLEEGWDGTYQGQLAPGDAYIYVAEIEDFMGNRHTQRGTFTLIR